MAPSPAEFDLAVIGAGINGAGIARDAALRGMSVIVFDKADACGGTSWASTRLIHGGLRYLEHGEISLVYESLRERRTLLQTAPHLVKPIRMNIPIYAGARRGRLLVRLGMLLYDLLSLGKAMPGHDMLSAAELLEAAPGLATQGLRGGARYCDAQVTYAERLVVENLLAARAAGARIMTWHAVEEIDVADGLARSIIARAVHGGTKIEVRPKCIVNAAGPWVDEVLATTGASPEPLIGGTRGSHIVVRGFPGAPGEAVYVEAAADGRPIFIVPWNGLYLIGTTDIRFDESPDRVAAGDGEIEYLLAEANRIFPGAGLERGDVCYDYSGVRPLPRREGPASAVTRKHIVRRNSAIAANLVSIIGGKLTTYRSLAEDCVGEVGRILGRELPDCQTDRIPLPGGAGLEQAAAVLRRVDMLSAAGVQRLLDVYGGRAVAVAELAGRDRRLAMTLDDQGTILAAEVVYALREEFAVTLVDIVFRRLMTGLAADQGRGIYGAIAGLAAAECGWDAAHRDSELARLEAYASRWRI